MTVHFLTFNTKSKFEPDCQGLSSLTDPMKFYDLAFELHQSWTSNLEVLRPKFATLSLEFIFRPIFLDSRTPSKIAKK